MRGIFVLKNIIQGVEVVTSLVDCVSEMARKDKNDYEEGGILVYII